MRMCHAVACLKCRLTTLLQLHIFYLRFFDTTLETCDMAKKQAKPEEESRVRRLAQSELERVHSVLRNQAAEVAGLVAAMKDSGIADIEIDGGGLAKRGTDIISRFIANAEKGVGKARRERSGSTL